MLLRRAALLRRGASARLRAFASAAAPPPPPPAEAAAAAAAAEPYGVDDERRFVGMTGAEILYDLMKAVRPFSSFFRPFSVSFPSLFSVPFPVLFSYLLVPFCETFFAKPFRTWTSSSAAAPVARSAPSCCCAFRSRLQRGRSHGWGLSPFLPFFADPRSLSGLFSVLCSLFSVLCSLFSVLCSLFSGLCSLVSGLWSLVSFRFVPSLSPRFLSPRLVSSLPHSVSSHLVSS
jgi:hypothetical protein